MHIVLKPCKIHRRGKELLPYMRLKRQSSRLFVISFPFCDPLPDELAALGRQRPPVPAFHSGKAEKDNEFLNTFQVVII